MREEKYMWESKAQLRARILELEERLEKEKCRCDQIWCRPTLGSEFFSQKALDEFNFIVTKNTLKAEIKQLKIHNENLAKETDAMRKVRDEAIAKYIIQKQELERVTKWHQDADKAAKHYMGLHRKVLEESTLILEENALIKKEIKRLLEENKNLKKEAKDFKYPINFGFDFGADKVCVVASRNIDGVMHVLNESICSGACIPLYRKNFELMEDNKRLKEDFNYLQYKFCKENEKHREWSLLNHKEIKRLKKKVNRLIENLKLHVPSEHHETMRAEYQECWDILKSTNNLLKELLGSQEICMQPNPFKPSSKFIKE